MANKGDTTQLVLNYSINDTPITEVTDIDDIELQLNQQGKSNALKFLLSDGSIYLDTDDNLYKVALTQENTFKLKEGSLTDDSEISYQLRVFKNNSVMSSDIGTFTLGPVLSRKVFE